MDKAQEFLTDPNLDHEPALSATDFALAVEVAKAAFLDFGPEVVVGSSRGGAVAMNLDTGGVPHVLLCPAWKGWGNVSTVPEKTIILHSREDETIPFADSVELLAASGLPEDRLVVTGMDHRLSDPESLHRLEESCRTLRGVLRTRGSRCVPVFPYVEAEKQ